MGEVWASASWPIFCLASLLRWNLNRGHGLDLVLSPRPLLGLGLKTGSRWKNFQGKSCYPLDETSQDLSKRVKMWQDQTWLQYWCEKGPKTVLKCVQKGPIWHYNKTEWDFTRLYKTVRDRVSSRYPWVSSKILNCYFWVSSQLLTYLKIMRCKVFELIKNHHMHCC